MKFSYRWLRELVPGLDTSPEDLMRLITLKTAECEGVEEFAPWLNQVCCARILAVEPLPGSHNVAADVDAGPVHGRKRVVCGAPNCRAGILTAYVPAGTWLNKREIRKAKIGGVESDGMLASGAELGLNRDSAGILELDGVPGAPIPGCSPDFVIEVDNKSLTHRPDLWGHHGMAREAAAITARELAEPVDLNLLPRAAGAWHVEIRDWERCPRYSALVFDNVTVGPSPLWLQAKLEAIGLNPISNIVDVTNYVMAELGQPMHAFDADKLRGDTIMVRAARDGESFHALNGEIYSLTPANLVIADHGGAVALAGVIGGMESAIGGGTTRIVLESANFQASNIRKTSAALKLRTDASMRFEKAQDPANTVRALALAVELLENVSPGIRVTGGLVDAWQPAGPPAAIRLPLDWLARKLGREVAPAEVRHILESLRFTVTEPEAGVFSVTPPSWRATRDITIKDDLLEEVGRMVGYASVPPQAPLQPVRAPWRNDQRQFHHRVRELASHLGFTETYNYSFLSEEVAAKFGFDLSRHVRVLNPIASDQVLLRTSLLPGIHRNVEENSKRFGEFRLFEIGNEIHKREAGLPAEQAHLMAAMFSKSGGDTAVFELKHLAESLMPGCAVTPVAPLAYEHPARAASVDWKGRTVGRLFELHPSLIDSGRAACLDLNLDLVQELSGGRAQYKPLRKYPSSEFDLSVITGLRVLVGGVRERIAALAGERLESIVFLRQYTGSPLPEDCKSVSFRLTVASPDRTLSNDDVIEIRNRVIDGLRQDGYDLRL